MEQQEVTKAQKAFFRKIYLAYLIDSEQHSARSLMTLTGMPRRTIQDTLADLSDIGIEAQFVQREGGRHNDGYYQLDDWGPIRRSWIERQLSQIEQSLALKKA